MHEAFFQAVEEDHSDWHENSKRLQVLAVMRTQHLKSEMPILKCPNLATRMSF